MSMKLLEVELQVYFPLYLLESICKATSKTFSAPVSAAAIAP